MKNESKNSASVTHVGKTFFFFFFLLISQENQKLCVYFCCDKAVDFFPSVADMQVIFLITGSE